MDESGTGLLHPRKGIDLSTRGYGQDTEKNLSNQATENGFYPSTIIWQ